MEKSKKNNVLNMDEYRKECKKGKEKSYVFALTGSIVATLGLIIILLTLVLKTSFSIEITLYIIGGICGVIGIILNLISERFYTIGYRNYMHEQEKIQKKNSTKTSNKKTNKKETSKQDVKKVQKKPKKKRETKSK